MASLNKTRMAGIDPDLFTSKGLKNIIYRYHRLERWYRYCGWRG
ncbi:MAG TPA: hypothetical protein VK106_01225 [Balneolaceae bacterium]|nr:hypothetical protein [Balneolaceae bacterium]